MSKLRIPGFTINGDKTRLRRGSFESVGSAKSKETGPLEEPSVEEDNTPDDDWMEKAYLETKERQEQEINELNFKMKQHRRKSLHLSKAKTTIQEATRTIGELASLTLASLKANEISSRDMTLSELEQELKHVKDHGVNVVDETLRDGDATGEEKKQEMSQANLITSIATLSKLTRKVTARKEILEKQVRALRDEYIKEKKSFERQLKDAVGAMSKLREEKEKAETLTKDIRVEFEGQIKDLIRQVDDAERKLHLLEIHKEELEKTLESKENELLDVPRMEEKYLRTARQLVVKKERTVIEKDMLLRQAEAKVKTSGYWHRRAVLLAEENLSLQKQLDKSRRNNIQAVTHLQRELQKETSKNQSHSKFASLRSEKQCDATLEECHTDTRAEIATELQSAEMPKDITHDEHMRQFQAAEMSRLRGVVRDLQEANRTLSLKLADARAYPLYNTRAPPETEEDADKMDSAQELEMLFHPDNEDEEIVYHETSEEREERELAERNAAQQRIERAVNMSLAYKAKLEQIRKARKYSDRVKAIRKLS